MAMWTVHWRACGGGANHWSGDKTTQSADVGVDGCNAYHTTVTTGRFESPAILTSLGAE